MDIISILGFVGAVIGSAAYAPQIIHIIREKCTGGISTRAYGLWTFSSTLLLITALSIGAPVFIFLCSAQLVATITILVFSMKNKGHVCVSHQVLSAEIPQL